MTDIAQAVRLYQDVRERKAELVRKHKEAIASYDNALAQLEAHFAATLSGQNVKSMNTPNGTVVLSTTTRLHITDWDEALDFIRKGERWEVLNKALSKNAIADYEQENQQAFPGTKLDKVQTVSVRKPAAGSRKE